MFHRVAPINGFGGYWVGRDSRYSIVCNTITKVPTIVNNVIMAKSRSTSNVTFQFLRRYWLIFTMGAFRYGVGIGWRMFMGWVALSHQGVVMGWAATRKLSEKQYTNLNSSNNQLKSSYNGTSSWLRLSNFSDDTVIMADHYMILAIITISNRSLPEI